MLRSLFLLVVAGATLPAAGLGGHHPVGARYDESQTIGLTGTLAAVVYRNPHSFLHLDVVDGHGVTHTWSVEWKAVEQLQNGQVEFDDLRPDDRLIVCGNPGRDPGEYRLWLLVLARLEDGLSTTASRCASG